MPNFPYVPFRSRRIKGFDLLARYLWPTPDKSVTPPGMGTTRNVKASDLMPSNLNSVPIWPTTSAPSTAVVIPPPAEFLLFLGDFIYADIPFYFGDDKEAYRRLYRRNYLSNSFRKIYERLRRYHPCYLTVDAVVSKKFYPAVFHTYDDHEVYQLNYQTSQVTLIAHIDYQQLPRSGE